MPDPTAPERRELPATMLEPCSFDDTPEQGSELRQVPLDPARVDRALRAVIADLDYDLHKALERDEDTGEDTYHETVTAFIAAYGEEAAAPTPHNCGDPNCWLEAKAEAAPVRSHLFGGGR